MKMKLVAVLMIAIELLSGGFYEKDVDNSVKFQNNVSAQEIYISKDNIGSFVQISECYDEEVEEHLNNGGVLIVADDVVVKEQVEEALNLKVRELPSDDKMAVVGSEITFYYKEGGVIATHEVFIADSETTTVEIVTEDVLEEIRTRQEYATQDNVMAIDDEGAVLIARKTYSYICEPKGTLKAVYKVYTKQDILGLDHYLIKAEITGSPGADLGELDTTYNTSYNGTKMAVRIESPTTSMSLVDGKPETVIGEDSIVINVGGTFGSEFSIEGGVSWTLDVNSVEINYSEASPVANWGLVFNGDVKTEKYKFTPYVEYSCPASKTSVVFDTYASYTLAAWYASPETIELDKSFTCTP